jgi:hypothetical protein
MKIEDRFLPSQDLRSQTVSRPEELRPGGVPGARRPEASSDSAGLSALSVAVSRGLEQDAPAVLARIARLQEAVLSGAYAVPAEQVSARLVDSLLQPDV